MKYFLERSKPAKSFDRSDFVVIRYTDTTVGKNKKLNDPYVIRDIENFLITQLPYDGIIDPSRVRKWVDKID